MQRLGPPRVKHEEPFQVEVANRDIMLVTECTTNLVLVVSKWKENICLNIVQLIRHQVIPGTPCLGKCNLDVDWRLGLLKLMYQGVMMVWKPEEKRSSERDVKRSASLPAVQIKRCLWKRENVM